MYFLWWSKIVFAKKFKVFMKHLLKKHNMYFVSLLREDDMDGLQTELSGFLKELHCPNDISGILNGGELKTKDHLKFICTFPVDLLFLTTPLRKTWIYNSHSFLKCFWAQSSRRHGWWGADTLQRADRKKVRCVRSSCQSVPCWISQSPEDWTQQECSLKSKTGWECGNTHLV